MQSLKSIKFLRLKIGEDNYQSKLSDIERVEIFNKANDGVKVKELSEQYKISESQVYNIKNSLSGSKAIENVINNKEKIKPNLMVTASNKTNKKLSLSLANFIRNDRLNNKISTKDLAKKYLVSVRTIQRILNNTMYKDKK